MPLPTPHPDPLPQGERGSNRSLRGWRAKPHRGRSPRVLNGEAMPFTRGTTFARQCRYRPLTLALSRKGRGEQTEVAEAGGRNSVEGRALVSCMAKPCHSHVGRHCTRQCRYPPLTLALSPQGGRGSNRSRRGWRSKPRRGRSPRVLRGEAVPLRRGAAFARQ